ncbi:hypothetical protein DAI22_10g208600 [Oryza sativa Japonica Group]|nr:hypothetical protein DAI22_10g208600 [Oryza sativa Japonica Group]
MFSGQSMVVVKLKADAPAPTRQPPTPPPPKQNFHRVGWREGITTGKPRKPNLSAGGRAIPARVSVNPKSNWELI